MKEIEERRYFHGVLRLIYNPESFRLIAELELKTSLFTLCFRLPHAIMTPRVKRCQGIVPLGD